MLFFVLFCLVLLTFGRALNTRGSRRKTICDNMQKPLSFFCIQVCLVITDGAQTTSGLKGPYTPLDKASQPLKDKGVDVWSIGVGKKANKADLVTIASDPGKVIVTSSFKSLKDILDDVQKAACEGIQITLFFILI